MKNENQQTDLQMNRIDVGVSIAKGLVGVAPFVGSAIGEIINNIIPNQRIARITKFLAKLDEKLRALGEEQLNTKLTDPANVDLMEDAFFQAARAFTDERINYIASIVKNGLTKEDLERIELKKILWLLGELNDMEVSLLYKHGLLYEHSDELTDEHRQAIRGPEVHMASTQEEFEKAAVYESYKERLFQLGLVAYSKSSILSKKRNEPLTGSDFDRETGRVKGGYVQITRLGRLLLKYIDLMPGPAALTPR